jgi:hypothetical protein
MERKFEKPWQAMPTRLIELGIRYSQKESDIDHHVGFLLLDLGVETTLKAFLVANRIPISPKLLFHEIVEKVQRELNNKNISSDIDFTEASYYHNVRNKLYHEAVSGIKSTNENLQKYAEFAKKVAEQLLGVIIEDIQEPQQLQQPLQSDESIKDERFITDERKHKQRSIQELTDELKERFKCFHETCHFITELKRPNLATRQVAAQIAHIRKNFIDEEENVPVSPGSFSRQRANLLLSFAQERLAFFNQLTGKEFDDEDQDYVDFLLMDVNHIYATVAINQISEQDDGHWGKYMEYVELLPELPNRWSYSRKEDGEIYEEYNQVRVWTDKIQVELDSWLKQQVTDVVLPSDNYSLCFSLGL